MDFKRTDRIGDLIQQEIADILTKKVKDPRIGFTTVTGVEVTRDLRHAKVFVSILGDDPTQKAGLKGLNSASGFIRGELGKRIQMKFTPELLFRLDKTLDKATQVLDLLDIIQDKPKKDTGR
jgi:ribosome-binding factor A